MQSNNKTTRTISQPKESHVCYIVTPTASEVNEGGDPEQHASLFRGEFPEQGMRSHRRLSGFFPSFNLQYEDKQAEITQL